MFRGHELFAALKPDSQDYRDCAVAMKFDLGAMEMVWTLSDLSRMEFLQTPAPISLFQVSQEMDVHFFLAKQDSAGTITWRRYGKLLADGFRWVQEDIEGTIDASLKTIRARRISTGECYLPVELASLLDAQRRQKICSRGPFYPGGAPTRLEDSELWTLLRYTEIAAAIEVFSCSNVIMVEHEPPKLINEKRKRKGKLPFFSYRTLHITGETPEKSTIEKGTHASPRLHLRRGHIRRLADGRRVWVTACLVGDKSKGFASHDYKVALRTQDNGRE